MTEQDFKEYLWDCAIKLRGSLSAAEYKYPVLGLVFLKYVSDMFDAQRELIVTRAIDQKSEFYIEDNALRTDWIAQAVEDRDSYTQDNVFWIPQEARFDTLLKQAGDPKLSILLDDAMAVIEKENEKLRGVLYRDFARLPLEHGKIGDLLAIIGRMKFDPKVHGSRDVFGEVYEYFLGNFAIEEGQKAGQFYTPRSVVRVLVEVLAPFEGRIYDPCCGSGGMFVYSERFIEVHGGKRGQAVIYGQELSATTRKLACMNLAVRGLDYDFGKEHGDTFFRDQHPDLKADYILANPQFNTEDWGADKLAKDPRWKYGVPPNGNGNFAWLQHMIAKLATTGRAGVVLANGSMSSNQSGEGEIRTNLVKADIVECMVALPGQLFTNTQIPACLWFLSREKKPGRNGKDDRCAQVLFIDARRMGSLILGSRKQKELSGEEIKKIAQTYHNWRGTRWAENGYVDVLGFCKSATLNEILQHSHVLTPGRYVGAKAQEDDGELFDEKMKKLTATLQLQQKEVAKLDATIAANLKELGYGG